MRRRSKARNVTPYAALHVLLVCVLTGGAGCVPEEDPEISHRIQPIVNGRPESGFPSVGRMSSASGQICTVSLIGYRTVLTAAHCVESKVLPTVVFGDEMFEAIAVHRHPQYSGQCASDRCYNDIAVLRLDATPKVTPTPISSRAPSFLDTITLVGYGSSGIDSATGKVRSDYAKRSVDTRVAWTNEASVGYVSLGDGGMICYGDSGGPSFVKFDGKLVQIGVHSQLKLQLGLFDLSPCKTSAWDQRVDTHQTWIREVAEQDVFVDAEVPAKPDTPDPPAEPSGSEPDQTAQGPADSGAADPPASSTEPVTVAIVSPTDGSVLASNLEITVEVTVKSQATVQRVDLAVNGQLLDSRDAAPYSFPVKLPDGIVRLEVRAVDTMGREARAKAEIKVDPTPRVSDTGTTSAAGTEDGAFFDCAMSHRPDQGPPLALILVGLLAFCRRRRRVPGPRS